MKNKALLSLCLPFLLYASGASSSSISYQLNFIGGNSYSYSYFVENDSLAIGIEEFTIWFDLGLYENLQIISSPIDWDGIAIEPDPLLPDDGFVDWLAFSLPISENSSLAGFSVSFDWLGAGTPGQQFFEIIDPLSFSVIESGVTSAVVPLPASFAMFVTALLTLVGFRRKI